MTVARPVLRVEALTSPRLTVRLTTAPRGLPHWRSYDQRHAAAWFLLANRFTLEDVKNLLGHGPIVLTRIEQRQRQVALGVDTVLSG